MRKHILALALFALSSSALAQTAAVFPIGVGPVQLTATATSTRAALAAPVKQYPFITATNTGTQAAYCTSGSATITVTQATATRAIQPGAQATWQDVTANSVACITPAGTTPIIIEQSTSPPALSRAPGTGGGGGGAVNSVTGNIVGGTATNPVVTQIQPDWGAATSSLAGILNKPVIPPAFTLSPATGISLGGVKVGINLGVTPDGTLSGTGGTVTSVGVSGGSTGLTVSGSPVTAVGTMTLGGVLGVASGGTGTSTPGLVAGRLGNVTVTGDWPNQTIAASGGGGGGAVQSVTGNIVAGTLANPVVTQVQSDWAATSTIAAIRNKPSIPAPLIFSQRNPRQLNSTSAVGNGSTSVTFGVDVTGLYTPGYLFAFTSRPTSLYFSVVSSSFSGGVSTVTFTPAANDTYPIGTQMWEVAQNTPLVIAEGDGIDLDEEGTLTVLSVAPATATTLGGISTGTPSQGQFLQGFNSDGSAKYGVPPIGQTPIDVSSWTNSSGVEYIADSSVPLQNIAVVVEAITPTNVLRVNTDIPGFTNNSEVVLTDISGRVISGTYSNSATTGLGYAQIQALNQDRNYLFTAIGNYQMSARQGKLATSALYMSGGTSSLASTKVSQVTLRNNLTATIDPANPNGIILDAVGGSASNALLLGNNTYGTTDIVATNAAGKMTLGGSGQGAIELSAANTVGAPSALSATATTGTLQVGVHRVQSGAALAVVTTDAVRFVNSLPAPTQSVVSANAQTIFSGAAPGWVITGSDVDEDGALWVLGEVTDNFKLSKITFSNYSTTPTFVTSNNISVTAPSGSLLAQANFMAITKTAAGVYTLMFTGSNSTPSDATRVYTATVTTTASTITVGAVTTFGPALQSSLYAVRTSATYGTYVASFSGGQVYKYAADKGTWSQSYALSPTDQSSQMAIDRGTGYIWVSYDEGRTLRISPTGQQTLFPQSASLTYSAVDQGENTWGLLSNGASAQIVTYATGPSGNANYLLALETAATAKVLDDLQLTGAVIDSAGSTGAAGQVMTVNNSGLPQWTAPAMQRSVYTYRLAADQVAAAQDTVTFGNTPEIALGTAFGTMASGVFTASRAVTVRANLSYNIQLSAATPDIWCAINGNWAGTRYLQTSDNGSNTVEKSSVSQLVSIPAGQTFACRANNALTWTGGSNGTVLELEALN